jgi:hypothetical protein
MWVLCAAVRPRIEVCTCVQTHRLRSAVGWMTLVVKYVWAALCSRNSHALGAADYTWRCGGLKTRVVIFVRLWFHHVFVKRACLRRS